MDSGQRRRPGHRARPVAGRGSSTQEVVARRVLRTIAFSFIPTLVMLGVLEGGARIAASCASGYWQPLYYGSAELHRFLFEDKAAIARKRRTFYVEHEPVDPVRFDPANGAVIRGRYVTCQTPPGSRRMLVFGASSVYGVTGPAKESFPSLHPDWFRRAAR